MNRSLLTPRWLLLHVLFIAATTSTGFLAWWQWERAHEAGGSAQNLGYALMWPLFGVFTVFLWLRVARLESRTPAESVDASDAVAPDAEESEQATGQPAASPAEHPVGKSRRRLVPLPASPVNADEDPELAAYNEYLRELNQVDQRN